MFAGVCVCVFSLSRFQSLLVFISLMRSALCPTSREMEEGERRSSIEGGSVFFFFDFRLIFLRMNGGDRKEKLIYNELLHSGHVGTRGGCCAAA